MHGDVRPCQKTRVWIEAAGLKEDLGRDGSKPQAYSHHRERLSTLLYLAGTGQDARSLLGEEEKVSNHQENWDGRGKRPRKGTPR